MSLSGIPALIAIILFIGLPIWLMTMIVSRTRRKAHNVTIRWDNIVKTEYEAPLGLTPAELGYIYDSKFQKRELIATILDLEQKGYLIIKKDTLLGYTIKPTDKISSELANHEKYILKHVDNTSDFLGFLNGWKNEFKDLVKVELFSKDLIKNSHLNSSILTRRITVIYIILNSFSSLYFLISGLRSGNIDDAIFFFFISPLLLAPIFIPVAVFSGIIYNTVVGQTSIWTKKMKSIWAEIEGFKQFIEQVELDNIQFESKELKQKTKNKSLAYAVALGLNTDWEKRF